MSSTELFKKIMLFKKTKQGQYTKHNSMGAHEVKLGPRLSEVRCERCADSPLTSVSQN